MAFVATINAPQPADSDSTISRLQQLFKIKEGLYKVSISKSSCPICWEVIDTVNDALVEKGISFCARARHSNVYLVDLPCLLSTSVQESMITRIKHKIQSEITDTIQEIKGSKKPHLSHKPKSLSIESMASVRSSSTADGSADCEAAYGDQASAQQDLCSL